MRTVKLVVIGPSGVGKSSIRNQYISGRFTTGYRATIGADFITKTLPHHSNPDELVTLQIWDTAGQERFSALSSAFFRGADAVILMFDVNQPQTLSALTKWWADFRDKAPVPDDEAAADFCCVVVGNKIDIAQAHTASSPGGGAHAPVSEAEARDFVHDLVPRPATPPSPTIRLAASDDDSFSPPEEDEDDLPPSPPPEHPDAPRVDSIAIGARRTHGSSRSRSRSTLFRGSGLAGTMTTTHTIYHTPSSSLFDAFESALSSPAFTALSAPASRSPSRDPDARASPGRSPRRMPSTSSMSSAPTITPSLFVRGQAGTTTATTPESGSPPGPSASTPPRPPPERYPRLFFTSAKTGEGVADVFEYVARRVVARQEYEEALEARTMHVHDADQGMSIRLGAGAPPSEGRWAGVSCCGA